MQATGFDEFETKFTQKGGVKMFFEIILAVAGVFIGLPLYFKIIVAVIAVLIGVPVYLWLGNNVGRYVIAVEVGVLAWVFEWFGVTFKSSGFKENYKDVLHNRDWFPKIFWPLLIISLAATLIIMLAVTLIRFCWRFLKAWAGLVKKCWQ